MTQSEELFFESMPIIETDAMGREKFWESKKGEE
jgi:hypothetical protein